MTFHDYYPGCLCPGRGFCPPDLSCCRSAASRSGSVLPFPPGVHSVRVPSTEEDLFLVLGEQAASVPPFSQFPSQRCSRYRERLLEKRSLWEQDPHLVGDLLFRVSESLCDAILRGELSDRCPVPDDPFPECDSCPSCAGPVSYIPFGDGFGWICDADCMYREQKDTAENKPNKRDENRRHLENARKARKIVNFLRKDQSLKVFGWGTRSRQRLPLSVKCGSLRSTVRSMYAPGLNPVQELSIKTSAKAEGQPCDECLTRMNSSFMGDYKEKRSKPVGVSREHLRAFGQAFARNVPWGWDTRKSPYVPNGHGTRKWSRRDGGNWADEGFSPECRTELVFSSGKPRVVSLYSGFNVSVLTPLHNSLYSFIKGRNWLLVGSPAHERLSYLGQGCQGKQWLSLDYESATDNIKIDYLKEMVAVLIQRADSLSADEVDCLRVLSSLSLDGQEAFSGQPMGSPMSFPLLCLANKTLIDLALTDLLVRGEISFNEWTSHRCLINGDDLLTRSCSNGDLFSAMCRHGGEIGLIVNQEKTMVSHRWAEINSTAFEELESGEIWLRKKTNVSALWMGAEVRDVLGYAVESSTSPWGFSVLVSANKSRLARQKIKTVRKLRPSYLGALLRSPAIRRALTSGPSANVPDVRNLFDTEPEPEGFSVTREESFEVITGEVTRLKQLQRWKGLFDESRKLGRLRKKVKAVEEGRADRKSALARLQPKRPEKGKRTLCVLARFWRRKRKEEVLAADTGPVFSTAEMIVFDGESCSPFTQMREILKQRKENCKCVPPSALLEPFRRFLGGIPDPFSEGEGEIAFVHA